MEIPYGYCHCGCGEKTKIATTTKTKLNLVKGEPQRYIQGHQRRKTHCKNGHARTPENVDSSRSCKICTKSNQEKLRRTKGIKPKKVDVCKNGHPRTPENLYPGSRCKTCAKESSLKNDWRKRNPEKRREYDRKLRQANPERCKKYCDNYKQKYPEKIKTRYRNYYMKNKSRIAQYNKEKGLQLHESYVALSLGFKTKDIPPYVINLARQVILAHRDLKEMKDESRTR